MRNTWVLGDPHAGGDPDADRELLLLLDRARDARADLLIMGDLFVAWIGIERFLTELQRSVLAKLKGIREAGGTIRFVVGNRDYLAERLIGSAFDQVYAEETLIDVSGVPTLIAHGDRLNPRDRSYLRWYRLSRSGPVARVMERLPTSIGKRIASDVERRMRGVNLAYKTGALPMDGIRAIAERARLAGAERVLLGHFHAPQTIDAVVPVVIAPGWFEHRVVLVGRELSAKPMAELF